MDVLNGMIDVAHVFVGGKVMQPNYFSVFTIFIGLLGHGMLETLLTTEILLV